MENREITIVYKGVEIKYTQGSNWAYVGNRIFPSVLAAKQVITRHQNRKAN